MQKHITQQTLPHKHVTLGKYCSDFEINANDAKPDVDNADADEAIQAKTGETVEAS